jgi:hypothetical protein
LFPIHTGDVFDGLEKGRIVAGQIFNFSVNHSRGSTGCILQKAERQMGDRDDSTITLDGRFENTMIPWWGGSLLLLTGAAKTSVIPLVSR